MMLWILLVALLCLLSLCFVLSSASSRRSIKILLRCKSFYILFILACGFTMMIAHVVGPKQALEAYVAHKQQEQKVAAALKEYGSKQAIIARFHQYVLAHPGVAKPWFLLGKLYLSQGQVDQAYQAFLKAYQLKPEVLYGLYAAQSDQYLHKGVLSQKGQVIVQALYKKASQVAPIMALEAERQMQLGHKEQALAIWQRLLGQLDPNVPLYQEVAKKIKSLASS